MTSYFYKNAYLSSIAFSFMVVPFCHSVEQLSDHDLDKLTAGAATTPFYGQLKNQDLSGTIDVTNTTSLGGEITNSSSNGESILISANSQAKLIIDHQLKLTHRAQHHSKTLNIDNAVGSDLANAVNISVINTQQSQILTQTNNTTQTEHNIASVGVSSWESGYNLNTQAKNHSSTRSYNHYKEEIHNDYTLQRVERFNSVDVEIESYDPRWLLENIEVSTPQQALTLIQGGEKTHTVSSEILNAWDFLDWFPDEITYTVDWGDTTLTMPQLTAGIVPTTNTDQPTFAQDKLTIKLEASPPELTFGEVKFYDDTGLIDVKLPTVAYTIPKLEHEITIDNPLSGLEMSINTGFALAGKGEIEGNFGGFNGLAQVNVVNILEDILKIDEINNEINKLDLFDIIPDIKLDFDLMLSIPIEIDLNPDLDFNDNPNIDVVDSSSAFHIRYDGVFCFELFGDGKCGRAEDTTTAYSIEDFSFTSTHTEQTSFSDSFNDHHEQIVRTGGKLSGGEAEKIILSGSELVSTENSVVQLSSQSQQSVSSLNVINASRTISGNSLNIQRTSTNTLSAPQISTMQLTQSNRFIQYR